MNYLQRSNNYQFNNIPGDWGLPIFGSGLGLVRDLLDVTRRRVHRYGEISRVQLGPERGLLVVGADNYKTIFTDPQQRFSARMGYLTQLGRFYEGGLLLRDADDHKSQRRIMQQAFKFPVLQGYLPRLETLLVNQLESWPKRQELVFYEHIKAALLEVGSHIFLGVDDFGDEASLLSHAFLDIAAGLGSILPWNFPGSAVRRGLKGRDTLHAYIVSKIDERRSGSGTDLFSQLAQATSEEGAMFSDEELCQHVSFLLFAAHDTTTSLLCHAMMYLGLHPDWQTRLRDECQTLGITKLEWSSRDQLPLMHQVLEEVMRLHPPVPVMTRRTTVDLELGGCAIPADSVLYLPTAYNQRDSRYWQDPDQFDPTRFSEARAEHKQHSFCFHPFGGGAHKCLGMHFAYLLAKVFLYHCLRGYQIKLGSNEMPPLDWIPIPKPANGLPLTLEPLL